ncbi:alginate export family protein [Rubellimicrobium roseum]|uniref:Alginate export domain-containing protein n=1 Tax=Rubellimicrobium roseum TaxID=687525 RepID=A0A5C4N732_9RHOB|nr:alginate export family protein [Rubellimicrobium roseum]TNC65383.1 hypothetical protein FHG71_17675 [Rubellimicrobium roseum]
MIGSTMARAGGLARTAALSALLAAAGAAPTLLHAQGFASTDPYQDRVIESVSIEIANPSRDDAVNRRVEDTVRRALELFPGQRYAEDRIGFAEGVARRNREVGNIEHAVTPGAAGGVDVTFTVEIADVERADDGRGYFLTWDRADLPTLYDRGGTVLRYRLDALALFYSNTNAWYGRPDLMLAGNPLVEGEPAGEGFDPWIEGYLHYGLYGITPVTDAFYVYGGLSAITSVSNGQELFTDRDRRYTGVEDAYLGFVTGRTTARGDRLAFNFTVGRQRFELANAFLIANTAANGQERAALQANARWSADLLVLGQVAWNDLKFEAFYVDPDELPPLDTDTRIVGVNLEAEPAPGLFLGASYLTVPESSQNYFGPTGTIIGTREGLEVIDARFTYRPQPQGQQGFFFGGEVARQTNRNFDMDARAAYAEVGYDWPQARWSPSVSYRLSYFSGDDADTGTYERWDPLLSGGNGEQWVQGANHFKVVQDSNVIAHRVQARFRVAPRVELVPQLWAFYADSETNIGGNPALSFLGDDEYGYEANLTAKWFVSRNVYVHGHVAYTVPGNAVSEALDGTEKDWWSAMVFVRYAF